MTRKPAIEMKQVGLKLICNCHKLERFIVKKHPRLGLLCKEGAAALRDSQRVIAAPEVLSVTAIQKYKEKSTTTIKNKAIKVFNAWIRRRDAGKPCISCGRFVTLQAGHFYSAGNFNHMRFNEDNVHGQCLQDNYFKQQSDTLYRVNLINKIGKARVERLDYLASQRTPSKDNKFFYIEVIEKYSLPK